MKQRGLGVKALAGLSILAAVIIVSTCITIGIEYKEHRMAEYSAEAFSHARTAAGYIDGDRVAGYLKTGIEDDYYRGIRDFLDITQQQADLKYFYIFVPYEDEIAYVWDTGKGDGVRPLGYRESYMAVRKEDVSQVFRANPPEHSSITRDEVYGYILSVYSPIFNSAGEPVAVVGVDLSMPVINRELLHFFMAIAISVFCVAAISMALFYALIRKNIIRPIARLDNAAKNMVGNLEQEHTLCVDIHTGDEIEGLSNTFVQMSQELRDYIQKLSAVTAEKERIGAELDIATQIQADMLPCIFPPFPDIEEFDIYASMAPAKEVGGDFYDFFMVDDTHLAMVVADVSGKGVPAALFMVIGKTLIKDHTNAGLPLGDVFTEVNRLLCESNRKGLFITAFECVLDLKTGHMAYVNAGHEPPFIAKYGEAYEVYKVRPQFVLAGFDGMIYRHGEMRLSPGDRLFLFTDGVTEATDMDGQLYGVERLGEALRVNSGKSPQELLDAVKRDIDLFVGEADQFDDITMLGLEFKKIQDSVTLKAELSQLDAMHDFVERFMENCGYGERAKSQVSIAVDEICANICCYAYPGGAGDLEIQVMATGETLELTFTDSGCAYDPLGREDPDITMKLEERKAGGLGIFLVKQMMDDLSYCRRDGKNVLRVVKNRA